MSTPGWRSGDFWRTCEVCGIRYRASETFKRWDGLYVCAEDFEQRHPQDFVRGRKDQQNVPDPRPEPTNVFVYPSGGPFFYVFVDNGIGKLEVVDATFRVYRGETTPAASAL